MIINILYLCIPNSYKKKKLVEFFNLTADTFQTPMPNCDSYSYKICLKEFAKFTKIQADICLQNESNLEKIKHQLYKSAYNFAKTMRKDFYVKTFKWDLTIFRLAYKLIGIDIKFKKARSTQLRFSVKEYRFIVDSCYFSNLYSANTCELISFLDKGFAAGLTDSNEFYFTDRITEGCKCCTGYIQRRLLK